MWNGGLKALSLIPAGLLLAEPLVDLGDHDPSPGGELVGTVGKTSFEVEQRVVGARRGAAAEMKDL
jgi:hypothetical protein